MEFNGYVFSNTPARVTSEVVKFLSTPLFNDDSNLPCPSTPQKARNSARELLGALIWSKERKCSYKASFPSFATGCASYIFTRGLVRPDSSSRNGSQSVKLPKLLVICFHFAYKLFLSYMYNQSNGNLYGDSKFS